ncbi:protein OBERON 3-like [Cucurbita moschata]|uniref:Protein OBERON 3-like n=1 Tax=Cucurbita moschata TaxID=3662 RepID=A0A6J1H705_CUCMO|nr:protein OBERON 3-like [Cucurbita moschata]
MFEGKDLASDGENSRTKLWRHVPERVRPNSDAKSGFSDKGFGFREESVMGSDGLYSKSPRIGNSGSQELTLSYLCENSKEKGYAASFEKGSYKGKEVLFSQNCNENDKWVERDFLNLNSIRGNQSKREIEEEIERENRGKKPKLETLNLSLALPEVSLSLTASNALHNEDPPPVRSKPCRSVQSLAPSMNNTQTTCSNDFTAASLSYSYSHQFSHSPSCSLTRNSTENYEYSVGRDDHIWNCGEGTNGSVHSRFKPLGDGVALSNHGSGLNSLLQGNRPLNKEVCNNSDEHSFFPSELPARPKMEAKSGNSIGRGSENLKGVEGITRPERIIREIVSESILVMSQIVQELPDETLASIKDYLKDLIAKPDKREELSSLQKRLERRSDLTKETLSKCHKAQLEILVAVKMGLASFISAKSRCSISELVDIFLFLKCRNCKNVIPVDDCDCKICSANKGFCSSCMCPICLNFDCANNTCSWVGCDVCSHWCHASCGIEKNLIRPGPSLKGPSGTTEMQFHCIACNHASEMFGFVKDVFVYCAKNWGLETLMKELECVKRIFIGSDDYKGKDLYIKAARILAKLESKALAPWEACNIILEYFNHGTSEISTSGVFSEKLGTTDTASLSKEGMSLPPSGSLPSSYVMQKNTPSRPHHDLITSDLQRNNLKATIGSDLNAVDEFRFGTYTKKDGLESLESIIRIKKAEAGMFQNKADEARREAERLRQIIIAKTEKLDEEYAEKIGKLCLKEVENRRRKKAEELKALENSQIDYYNMKMRMQKEIGGLLERMEMTKKQIV